MGSSAQMKKEEHRWLTYGDREAKSTCTGISRGGDGVVSVCGSSLWITSLFSMKWEARS